jgi:hypothetical protein
MILKYTVFVFREPSERAVFCIGRHGCLHSRRGLYATDRAGVGAGVLKNERVIHCCSRTEGEADQEQGTLKSNERRNTVL